jgi:hypothetical protein
MKNTTKILTFGIVPAIVLAILIYDVYAIAKGGTEASISSILIVSAYKMPFMVYMIGLFNGILVGHLFWRMRPNKDTKEIDNVEHN